MLGHIPSYINTQTGTAKVSCFNLFFHGTRAFTSYLHDDRGFLFGSVGDNSSLAYFREVNSGEFSYMESSCSLCSSEGQLQEFLDDKVVFPPKELITDEKKTKISSLKYARVVAKEQ
jgi:hypothetical protein